MAEAAVISALQKLADVAVQKTLELYEVSDQIEPIRLDLELIQAFLRDVDAKQQKTESVKVWVNQVTAVAHRIGGAMDTFLVEIENQSKLQEDDKCCGCFSKCWTVAKHPVKLSTLSSEIKAIREEMKRIFETRTQLGIITEAASGSEKPPQLPFRPTKPIHVDDSEVVGFDSDKHKIISHLLNKDISRRTVLSIVGVGGLGKTTLAQKVYKSAKLNAEFPSRAWLSISQKFDENNLCREILYSVEPAMKDKRLSDEEVLVELEKLLRAKRYLIILDDVWTVDLWKRLKIALPDAKNASRVIITTRNLDIALAADRNTEPYKLDYLNEDDSLALLFRKALQQDIEPDKYPSHLVEIAKKLMGKCGRLPLALVVLGGMLSTESDTYIAWKRVYDTLDWHNDHGENCSQILRMSYLELRYEQKQCFLYFAAFPEGHKISAEHITRLWIAEGLIPIDGKGTLEDRARNYLEDFVKRCMVQVVTKSWNGHCKYCRIHDLLRDLAIHEAKKDNFFTVISKPEDGSQLVSKLEAHRVALQFDTSTGYTIQSTKFRSLLCFGGSVRIYQGFTQLRVLVFDGIDFGGNKTGKNWLEGLVHMKYLGSRKCENAVGIFENISFNFMKNLETFDCGLSDIGDMKNLSWWEVPTLRHVITGFTALLCPLKWDNLKNLQTLNWVFLEGIPKLESNVNLRTLKIKLRKDDESPKALKALLSRAKHLVSLAINCDLFSEKLFQTAGIRELSCYETIHCLRLCGPWASARIPSLEIFPKNLTKLKLVYSEILEDPVPLLERLQCLRILQLLGEAYNRKKMTCSAGGFPNLRKLVLKYLPNISEWDIKEGAMPVLTRLSIGSCPSLSRLPELQYLQSLQELIVRRYSPELQTRLQLEDHCKIKRIPSVRFEFLLEFSDGSDYTHVYMYM